MKDYNEIAKKYAKQQGYDTVRAAGVRNGYKYFHIYSEASVGHKTGMPQFVKISEYGIPYPVNTLSERMWATKQEVSLNNL